MKKNYSTLIQIPDGLEVAVDNNKIKVKGSKGELQRNFLNPRILIIKLDNSIKIECKKDVKFAKKDKMFINTYRAHIKNLFNGVKEEYTAKLKICSGHFPMNVSIDANNLIIKNFLGEKIPRKTQINKNVRVQIQGDEIIVIGIDKDLVGQTAANIEQATRITNRDRRVFQDGCFIIKKP